MTQEKLFTEIHMLRSNFKVILVSLLLTAALTLTACNEITTPAELNVTDSSDTGEIVKDTSEKTEKTDEPAAETTEKTVVTAQTNTAEQPSEEAAEASVPEITVQPEVSEPPANTVPAETPTTVLIPAPKWTETEANGTMYINAEEVFSRAEAVQDSKKVKRYRLNDSVNITARTDTGYCKLDSGDYIHLSYLNINKVEITAATTAPPVTEMTTAAPVVTTEAYTAPEETTPSVTEGNYGQRGNTQAELDFIERVFELTNEERAKEGLPAYQHMDALDVIASVRAWELTVEYRPDHTRPDGSSCSGAFNENGIIYGAWGENIAAGQDTPESVVEAWLNSPYHRDAVLNTEFTYMGVGFYYIKDDYQNYYYFWTQEFYCY